MANKISLSRFKRQIVASRRYFVALAMPVALVAVEVVAVALAVAMAIAVAHRSSTSRKSEDEISACLLRLWLQFHQCASSAAFTQTGN